MLKLCEIDDCSEPIRARGWCSKHYQRWRNHGDHLWEPSNRQRRSAAQRLAEGIKWCPKCDQERALTDFYRNASRPDGCSTYCKPCANDRHRQWVSDHTEHRQAWNRERSKRRDREQLNAAARKRRTTQAGKRATLHGRLMQEYGISVDRYESMVEQQSGLCLICQQPPSGASHADERLHVDHDHASGRIRGLLCRPCNMGMGAFGDDPALLAAAVAYIDTATTA